MHLNGCAQVQGLKIVKCLKLTNKECLNQMKSEKISINVNTSSLAIIDYLVSNAIYSSRSEFTRTAIAKLIETHKNDINNFVQFNYHTNVSSASIKQFGGFGVIHLRKSEVRQLLHQSEKINIRVIGLLTIDKSVTAEEISKVVNTVDVFGKISADDSVVEELNKLLNSK